MPPGMLALEPPWRNVFDNVVTVQFDHRLLAIGTLLMVIGYWLYGRNRALPARARVAVHGLLAIACTQVALGVSTLLLHVPTALAAAHQGCALVLFTVALYLCHALRGNPQ